MNETWRVYLRRDGRVVRTVVVEHLGRALEIWGSGEIYSVIDIMPATREAFADYREPPAR